MKGMLSSGSGLGRLLSTAVALLAVAAMSATGCGDDGGTTGGGGSGGTICDGGVFDADGNCVAKCDPSKCLEGNTCVSNQCRFICDGHPECYPGSQACVASLEDDTGKLVNVCQDIGRLAGPVGGFPQGTYGTSCFFGESDCAVQTACPNGLECDPASCADCGLAADLCPNEDGSGCNLGRCASSGELCIFNTCAAAECTPFTCLTAGEGDAEAYCTHHDCDDDSECPAGFFCGETRDPHEICGVMPPKGNNGLCGETPDACIDPSSFTANGAQYFEGSQCLLRKTCRIRNECEACSENLDCSYGSGWACTQHSGTAVCAAFCTNDSECLRDESCVAYNPAALLGERAGFCQDAPGVPCGLNDDCAGQVCSPIVGTCGQSPRFDCSQDADCPIVGDSCQARSVCVPKAGECSPAAPPAEPFCQHCTKDSDCGGVGSTYVCNEFGGSLSCFDAGFSTPCMVDADCPVSPSGLPGECLDEAEGVQPTSSVYQTCYVPFVSDTIGFSCW
jgi:hypothetical protein